MGLVFKCTFSTYCLLLFTFHVFKDICNCLNAVYIKCIIIMMTVTCAVDVDFIHAEVEAGEDLASCCSSRCVQMAGLGVDCVLELRD